MDMDHPWLICMLILVLIAQRRWRRSVCAWVIRLWSSPSCEIWQEHAAGKGIDNRASCVILLHLLRRLQSQSLSCRLTALVTVQEEVGLRGAQVAFARLQPDLAIVVDTFPAAGTPDTRHLAYTARIGQGALITPSSSSGDSGFLIPRA